VPAPGRQAFEGLAFVGRDAEIETLLAAAGSPEPGAVLVAGSPGAGKSRLLAEAAARSELPVLSVRAFLPERNEPWSFARGLLREALDLDLDAAAAVPDRAASALADVVPELEELRPVTGVTVDPESRRALALEAAARVMAAATGKGALVIADDLQWADPTSLAVLGLVARRVPNAALVLAYRTEEVTSESPAYTFIDELFSMRASVVELAVGPLAVEAIAAVLTDAELVAAIAEETDRTPLAVIEAVRGLAAEGVIEPDARGAWGPCRAGAAARAREVARSGQRRAIQARARRQSSSRRQLLALLSLLGREAPARVLVRATGAAEAKILEDLDALARGALARLGDAGWATAHDLVGEAVAEGLERADRGRFHHLLARALGEEAGDPAEIARHLAGAGDREAAAAAFSQAARQRLEQFAGAEARQLAEAGLALEPRGETLGALLRIRGEARAIRGDPAGARDDLHAALPSLPRGADRSRALVRIAELTWVVDSAQAGVLVEMALAEAGSDREARAEALTVAANFDANDNEIGRAEERASEALTLFEDLGEPAGLASVTDLRAIVAFFRGQLVEAGELYERAARLYRASGRLLKVGNPWGMRAWTLLFAGHPREALAEIEGALELERSLGQTEGELFCRWLRGEILCTLGPLDEARRDLDAALAGCRELGHRELVATTLRALALWHLASGDLEGAEEAAREAIEPGAGLAAHPAYNSACLASVLVERGALDEAEAAATEAVQSGMGIPGFDGSLVLAEVALARGDPDGERLAAGALAATEASGYLNSRTRQRLEARVPEWRGLLSAPARRREQRVFMFTDIVSSTNLVEMLGDEAWDHLLRWHDQTLRALFSEHRGEEVNRIGDGFFVAFESAADAVGCASAIQRDLARHRAEHGFAPQVRIGLHAAEATQEGADYQGRGVHEAARISGTAAGGEIVASLGVVQGLPELDVSEPRPVSLKGLSEPIDVVSISWS
jgi:class 3 adenylate cyclase